jgi:hypothetical protein
MNSSKKTSDEKRGNSKKTQRGSAKKTSDGKRGNPLKNEKGLIKKISQGKEALAKRKKFQQTYTFTEASYANLTVESEGDAFRLYHKLQVA